MRRLLYVSVKPSREGAGASAGKGAGARGGAGALVLGHPGDAGQAPKCCSSRESSKGRMNDKVVNSVLQKF